MYRGFEDLTFGFEFEGCVKGGVEMARILIGNWGTVKEDNSLSCDGFEVASQVYKNWERFSSTYLIFLECLKQEKGIHLEPAAATHFHSSTLPLTIERKRLIRLYQIGALIEPLFFAIKKIINSELTICCLNRPTKEELSKVNDITDIVNIFQKSRQSVINYSAYFEYCSKDLHDTIEFRPLPSRLSIEANIVYLKLYENILKLAINCDKRIPDLYSKYALKSKAVTLETIMLGAKLLNLTYKDLFYLFFKNPNSVIRQLDTTVEEYIKKEIERWF